MKRVMKAFIISMICWVGMAIFSCSKDDPFHPSGGTDTTKVSEPPFDINSINDTYAALAPFENYRRWGPYNVHDPSIIKDGEYFYCYNTDVGFGIDVRSGIQIRKSKDLVQWEFVGWVFSKLPQMGSDFIKQNGGTPNNSLWAPYVTKVGQEFRLYYSLASNKSRLSVIGMASSTSPVGPWTEKGIVVTSSDDNSIQTNAIDPTVLIDKSGAHWMYYGSAWDGIYILKLDPATGLAKTSSDRGKRISQRGSTAGKINGNIEGPEIIYNESLNKYYLFIAYDWLQTKYNVRVGRSDSPEGPFYDFDHVDLNAEVDHAPMIVAPYQFKGHGGWQGTAHCAVFKDNGQYYMAHQGRPGVNSYYMVLHVRKLFWTDDGWPIVSPERYAATEQSSILLTDIAGNWEEIVLGYQVVPGYASEQVSPNFQEAVITTLDVEGTINGDATSHWSYTAPKLELNWSNGSRIEKVIVERGRDWENKKPCLIFTGLDQQGTAIWGKK
jgi:arabinan endo-1,5-alpha-L-arabinosidase